MQTEELTAIVKANYPLFAGSILLRFGTCTGMGTAIKFGNLPPQSIIVPHSP